MKQHIKLKYYGKWEGRKEGDFLWVFWFADKHINTDDLIKTVSCFSVCLA